MRLAICTGSRTLSGYVTLTSMTGWPTDPTESSDGGMVAYATTLTGMFTSLTPPGRPPHTFAYTEVI